MWRKRQRSGWNLTDTILPRFCFVAFFTVWLSDVLIFSYWPRRSFRMGGTSAHWRTRRALKIAGSCITWATQGVAIILSIIWRKPLIPTFTLDTSDEENSLFASGIKLKRDIS